MELRNESKNEFVDISSEEWRRYETPFGSFQIDAPLYLATSQSGHRVLDASGTSHYIDIRQGFYLSWKAKDGQPHFVK